MSTPPQPALQRILVKWIREHRRTVPARALARLARFYYEAWEFPGFEIDSNGERALLAALRGERIANVFDVGANVGDWSATACEILHPRCIHAFEPVPATHQQLAARMASDPAVIAHPFGLGAEEKEAEITYYGDKLSFLSTVNFAVRPNLPSTTLSIHLRKGDNLMAELEHPAIDFLKIDVEGMEIEVLSGLENTFRKGLVRFVQFEHHPGRVLLRQFHDFFGSHGFRVGKMYARYVNFAPYNFTMERYAGPNYVAVPAARTALIEHLGQGYT